MPNGYIHLVIGINGWSSRVPAYILLMRDEHLPFRLDPQPVVERVAYSINHLRMPRRLTHEHGGVT